MNGFCNIRKHLPQKCQNRAFKVNQLQNMTNINTDRIMKVRFDLKVVLEC